MSDPTAFILAVLALLATPGPTNTLLAASGAAMGFGRSLRLVPAELSGYLLSIIGLITLAGPLVAAHPMVAVGLKLMAGLWLGCCALCLWRGSVSSDEANPTRISARRVFVTTALNPKALVFALVIIPQGSPAETVPWLAGFSALVILVATAWITFGALAARSAGHLATPRRISRAAALVLAVFAMVIAGAAIAAVVYPK